MTANWRNRTLWTGDNLDVMRGMNSESVDLIYLDPPFNSNVDYSAPIGSEAAGAAFKDTWKLSDVDEAWHGEIADRQPALYAIIDAADLAHGKNMKSYLIMMAVRLLEMHRLLKPTGSIYLHCDPTASHYLKMLMDTVFGSRRFLNEITWKRSYAHNDTRQGMRRAGRICDSLLVYTGTGSHTWNATYMPYSEDYLQQEYRHVTPEGRRYKETDVTAAKPGGDTEYDWPVKQSMSPESRWLPDLTEEYRAARPQWEYKRVRPYRGRYWAYSKANLIGFWDEGRLIHRRTGMPRLMQFADAMPGIPLQNLWDDLAPATGSERTRYPTQKPLSLLNRIIRVSSNEGDVVLDPFCGCATTLVAADRLNRQWTGIDLSPLAARLVLKRLRDDRGPLFDDVVHREDVPRRTDLGELPNYRTHKHTLYGRQEGVCAGCRILFPFRNFTVDHIIPQTKGGSDHLDNLQPLCGACNSMKGAGTQEQLIVRLTEQGIRQ